MSIEVQFEIILASFFFGIYFMLAYDFFNRLFINKKGKLIRLIFEILFFLSNTLLYFLLMLKISFASFSIFMFLFIFLGSLFYSILFRKEILEFYEFIFVSINKKISNIKLSMKAKFDIIKNRKKKKKNEKNKRSKKHNKRKE